MTGCSEKFLCASDDNLLKWNIEMLILRWSSCPDIVIWHMLTIECVWTHLLLFSLDAKSQWWRGRFTTARTPSGSAHFSVRRLYQSVHLFESKCSVCYIGLIYIHKSCALCILMDKHAARFFCSIHAFQMLFIKLSCDSKIVFTMQSSWVRSPVNAWTDKKSNANLACNASCFG